MKNLLKTLFLFVALFAFMQGVWAQNFITDVMIISGNQSQTDGYKTQYQNEGWTVIDNDLNRVQAATLYTCSIRRMKVREAVARPSRDSISKREIAIIPIL